MFYLLLGFILILILKLNRQANQLTTASNYKGWHIFGGLIAAAALVMLIVAFQIPKPPKLPYNRLRDKKIAAQPQPLIQVPKRLLNPKEWFKISSEVHKKFKLGSHCNLSVVYDKQLVFYLPSRRSYSRLDLLSFTIPAGTSLSTVFGPHSTPSDKGYEFNLPWGIFNQRLIVQEQESVIRSDYEPAPFYFSQTNAHAFDLDLKTFANAAEQMAYIGIEEKADGQQKVYKQPIKTKMRLDPTHHPLIMIPFHSQEEMVAITYPKLLSITNTYARSNFYSELDQKLGQNLQSVQNANLWGLLPRCIPLIIILVFALFGLWLNFGSPFPVKIYLLLLCLMGTGFAKLRDYRFAQTPNHLILNNYCIPESRKVMHTALTQSLPYSEAYDQLKTLLNISQLNKFPKSVILNYDPAKKPFLTFRFFDDDELTEIYLIGNQFRRFQHGGTSTCIIYLQQLIAEQARHFRQTHPEAKSFLFDLRFFSLRPIQTEKRPGETKTEYLHREFITFFTDLYQTETDALGAK